MSTMADSSESCGIMAGPFHACDVDSNSSVSSRSSVSFGEVQLREFVRVVGDNPCVSDRGPPLSIGWAYYEHSSLPLDEYERQQVRHGHRQKSFGGSKTMRTEDFSSLERLNGHARRMILERGFSVSPEDIVAMEKEVERTKRRRHQTARQGKWRERVELFVESAGRRLKRT